MADRDRDSMLVYFDRMKYTVFQTILPQVLLVQDHQESL